MKKNKSYNYFDKYILRTPLLPLNFFLELTDEIHISDKKLKEILKNEIVREAIYLASPILYDEIIKMCENQISSVKDAEKIKTSLLKYISRMCSRCTPFGLFAGCSVGQIGNSTNIILKDASKNFRHTRFDMNFLVALSQDLIKIGFIQEQLLFYPNSSIYNVGNSYRLVEYHYVESKRIHQIIEINKSEYLERILILAKNGVYKKDLCFSIITDEISLKDAESFIDELISSQVIISELEPSISGPEFYFQILNILKKIDGAEHIISILSNLEQKISILDSKIGNSQTIYLEIVSILEELKTKYDIKYLFQTDMKLNTASNTIDTSVLETLEKGFMILNKLSVPIEKTSINDFKKAFYERYEDREMPLSKVLDTEIGIGYRQISGFGDINPLVDDIVIGNSEEVSKDFKWNNRDSLLQKKLYDAYKKNAYSIKLTDDDFKNSNNDWKNLPDTLSLFTEIYKNGNEHFISILPFDGSSATCLLGRFCHSDSDINNFVESIVKLEEAINKEKLLAEIIHLPQSRVGNIMMRPFLREFEIPYLGKSLLNNEKQILVEDITIQIKNDKIILKSIKHKKEIIPYLSNAHNFSTDSLPIYHFLCDLQNQNNRSLHFGYGSLSSLNDFLPRIEYQNIILFKAVWNIKNEDIADLLKSENDDNLLAKTTLFLETKKIPQLVMLADYDNELLINFRNINSIKMFLSSIKKRQNFKLTEFLYDKDFYVKDNENKNYTNQIIFSFFNNEKIELNDNKIY